MDYEKIVELYELLAQTPQRIEKTEYLAAFLRQVDELVQVISLLQGHIFPFWDDRKLGFSSRLMLKAICRASGADEKTVERVWQETGDLGDCAARMLASRQQLSIFSDMSEIAKAQSSSSAISEHAQKHAAGFSPRVFDKLTVQKVYSSLQKLASIEGEKSVDIKINLVSELLISATLSEARFIVRTVLEELRVGLGDGTLRDALVAAFIPVSRDNREEYNLAVDKVQHALDLCNDFGVVAAELKRSGLDGLNGITLRVGVPIQVMLAMKEKTIPAAFERVGKPAALEYKLDGFRLQIHKNKKIKLFTRRLEDVTPQFPDVVAVLSELPENIILDCEVVGVVNNSFVPFQEISQRIKRKHDIGKMAKQLPVHVYVFDILFYQKSVLDLSFRERRVLLENVIKENELVKIMPHVITEDEHTAEDFYQQSLAAGNEGVMFKSLEAQYQSGARVGSMVKMKPILETLDVVIVGAEWGEGKRSKWLSSYLVACRSDDGLVNVGNVSTGLKEKAEEGLCFQDITMLLKPLVIQQDGKSVIVTPQIVLEVAFEEIQRSSNGNGYALRFPRVVRLREDRDEKSCSTLADVERIFREQ